MEKMSKIILIVAIVILLIPSIVHDTNSSAFQTEREIVCKNNNFTPFPSNIPQKTSIPGMSEYFFVPRDIQLHDDAYHFTRSLHSMEWWYFDATFNNGYSAQMSIRIMSILNIGLVFARLDIYNDGILLSNNQEIYTIKSFYGSFEKPYVTLNNKEIINGYIDETTQEWVYTVSFDFQDAAASLTFVSETKGWKGQLKGGDWWAVVLPRASVHGVITIQNIDIPVQGRGYHDHNWDVRINAGINFGWIWGKINSPNYTLTYSAILSMRFIEQPILVINEKNGNYINIKSEDIFFERDDYSMENGLFVPHSFTLTVDSDDFYIRVTLETFEIHHDRFFIVSNYWRFHVQCTGIIIINGVSETINQIEIAEFIRFR